jgi:hypothetical protein
MNNDKLFIPTKCKVGYNLRTDTYTGKLGYIIYNDGKTWRKENSWKNWINLPNEVIRTKWNYELKKYDEFILDDTFKPIEFDNIPTEGFVLNKKVGGNNYSWNPRQTYSRVYDPRGWEFEITIPNLLFILECTNSIKGKGLEGEFVYSWDGKDLVLLPCDSENYKSSVQFTELQSKKVSSKELKEGYTYLNSKRQEVIYLGKLPIVKKVKDGVENYEYDRGYYYGKEIRQRIKYKKVIQKEFVFYNLNKTNWNYKEVNDEKGIYTNYEIGVNTSKIKQLQSDSIVENYPELIENYYKTFKTKLDE